MSNKSTDTREQIAVRIAEWDRQQVPRDVSYQKSADEILAIAIKSPEVTERYKPVIMALKYLLSTKRYKDEIGKDGTYESMRNEAWLRAEQAIEALKEAQSDE